METLAVLFRQRLNSHHQITTSVIDVGPFFNSRSNNTAAIVNTRPTYIVETATLECSPISLHQQIQQFAHTVIAAGGDCLDIVPLFLLPGVHVCEDIPQEIAIAQKYLASQIKLKLNPHLGSYNKLKDLIAQQFSQNPSTTRIFLAHGSRRPAAINTVNHLARGFGAVTAFWSVSPSLSARISELIKKGHQNISIFPYFLFSGGIVQAIADQIQSLQVAHPSLQLHLGQPLGATLELAQVILEEVTR